MTKPLPSLSELTALRAPFLCSVMQIEPQWIDYNGHLNMAYYNVIMDRSIDELFAALGMGPNYLRERNCSTMTAECHVRYIREVHLGDPLQVSAYVIAVDEKRLHTFEELRHATEGWLSATSENMSLHIDMNVRKVAPFPTDIAERIRAVAGAHARLPRPDGAGRRIEMPVKAAARAGAA
ncbi:thioesterase family protein [Bradyrhizobium sp. LHD-71]|uniref:thioesterase family protein n=1 Tax=Bradyrhizobium sp. LHD-71 TaxID=3072141 RepID=UPI00280C9E3A|nr:thioesterase family protein [Bradyrhizobium sp. LHD-71]MDQ8727834.1 thioesterase family protein [Bradyrhizobium sp. LHD-71]